MTLIVSSIVGNSMNKIVLWIDINVCVDDWTAERAIIASNDANTFRAISSRKKSPAAFLFD